MDFNSACSNKSAEELKCAESYGLGHVLTKNDFYLFDFLIYYLVFFYSIMCTIASKIRLIQVILEICYEYPQSHSQLQARLT